jgi:hypothetical protein
MMPRQSTTSAHKQASSSTGLHGHDVHCSSTGLQVRVNAGSMPCAGQGGLNHDRVGLGHELIRGGIEGTVKHSAAGMTLSRTMIVCRALEQILDPHTITGLAISNDAAVYSRRSSRRCRTQPTWNSANSRIAYREFTARHAGCVAMVGGALRPDVQSRLFGR